MRDGATGRERTGTRTIGAPARGRGAWAVGAAAVLAAGLLASCTSSASDSSQQGGADPKPTRDAARPEEHLYVVDASSGTAKADGDQVVVSLQLDDDRVVWFQDRPERDHGHVAAADLVDDWGALGFTDDPPNVLVAPDDASAPVALEVADPSYDADSRTLRFTGSPAKGASTTLPSTFDGASALIDGVGTKGSGDGSAAKEFAQRAGSASIDPLDGGRFALTLDDVSPRTTWVADRPHRGAGVLADQTFVDRWAVEGFAEDPPNAELVVGSGDDAQRIGVELASPSYDAKARTLTYVASTLPGTTGAASTEPDVPQIEESDQPSTLFIDGAAAVEAEFGVCGEWHDWTPAHRAGGTYVIEAWGGAGGAGGNGGGAGGAGGYSVARVDATLVDIVSAHQPVTAMVGCGGGAGNTIDQGLTSEDQRGGGGGGGGSSALRMLDESNAPQPGCVPARVFIVKTNVACTVFAVAGGGGGGGGYTQGTGKSSGGAGGRTGPKGSDGGSLDSAGGGAGGGSNAAPTGGVCGAANEGGNAAACRWTSPDDVTTDSIGTTGTSGRGGDGGAAAYPDGQDEPPEAAGGEGGSVPNDHDGDGAGGSGLPGNSWPKNELGQKSGSGPGGGGGGWGGGGGGDVTFDGSLASVPKSATGGGGGGSFSYSEGIGWADGGSSPGGANGWIRISWDPGGMLPLVVTADGTVNANVQSGWMNGGALTSDGVRWVGRGKVGASGIVGAAATGGDVVAIAKDGDGLQAHVSSDGGASWKPAGALPSGISFVDVAGDDRTVVVASADGVVAWSRDSGATWKTSGTGLTKVSAIDRVPGVEGTFVAVGGSQVAIGSSGSGSVSWKLDTADSPGKDLTAVAGVGPAMVVVDQATGTASTKAATAGGTWQTSAPLPHRGQLIGAAGTDSAIPIPGKDQPGVVGSVMVIDASSPVVDLSPDISLSTAGTWPATGIPELPQADAATTTRPQIVEQCRGIFYIANGAPSASQAQVWTSGDVPTQAVTGFGWVTGVPGTVPADVVAIAC